jgi:hypothetical protein
VLNLQKRGGAERRKYKPIHNQWGAMHCTPSKQVRSFIRCGAALLTISALGLAQQSSDNANRTVVTSAGAAKGAFDQLAKLAGDWEGTIGHSRALGPAHVNIAVTAKGTAILQRTIIQDPVEMVSMIYLDRGRLVLRHFCAAGNQPTMVLMNPVSNKSARFELDGGGGLAAASDLHMHATDIIVENQDRIAITWTTYDGGRHAGVDTIFLTRRKTSMRNSSP